LGAVLGERGNLEEAIAELRAALRIKPDSADARCNLGIALSIQGKLEEAVTEFREALRLTPDDPEVHASRGLAFRSRGEFAEAMAELRKAHDLAKTKRRLAQDIERDLANTELHASLAHRLPAILAGKVKPSDPAEALGFAQLCSEKKLQGASARLWRDAFNAWPALADDMKVQNRYKAACAAALASSGHSKDDPPLGDAAKARWRKQALDWLKADLAARSKVVESGPSQEREATSQTLQHWKADPNLAGVRDPVTLAKLPEDERKACRALWAEVDALFRKAQDAKP